MAVDLAAFDESVREVKALLASKAAAPRAAPLASLLTASFDVLSADHYVRSDFYPLLQAEPATPSGRAAQHIGRTRRRVVAGRIA